MKFSVYLNNVSAVEICDGVTVTISAKSNPAFAGNAAETVDFLQRLGIGHSVEIRHELGARSCMNKRALWESIRFLGTKPADSEFCKFYPLGDESGFIGINETYDLGKSGKGVFVIPCGDGFSTLGFAYAEKRARGVLEWIGGKFRYSPKFNSLVNLYEEYKRAMKEGAEYAAKTGRKCPLELTPQLIGLEGKRVAIINADGSEESRFRVGRSTGWLPCHLEIMPNAHGGSSVYIPEGATIRIL